MDRGRWRAVVLVALLLLATPGVVLPAEARVPDDDGQPVAGAVAGSPERVETRGAAVGTGTTQVADGDIVVTQEYRLTPDRPGYIDVQWRFEMPDSVTELTTALPPAAGNVRTTRFEQTGQRRYGWTGEGSTGSITFTRPANETGRVRGPEGSDGRYLFADTGEWALVERQSTPGFSYRGFWEDPPEVVYRNRTAGPGVVGQALVYLGPHETDTRTAHGQTFRLVVPDAATLAAGREAIFESVTAAADRLRVGDRDPRVLMIAAPASVAWGVRGLQTGDRDFYAVADEPVNAARNVWIHEYVHSRQEFAPGPATRWFTEASAEYYAARLTLDQDRIEFETFADHLAVGSSRRYDDVVLSDPDTWHDSADYFKGSLAAGDLDRRIRLATDSRATLQGVFGRLNDRTDPVSAEAFVEFVTRTAGGSVTDATRRYTLTTATPAMWSVGQHGDAFGTLPPSIRYAFPGAGSDGVRVSGVYRNGTLGVGPLVANETLAVDVRVTNEGGTTGSYDLAFGVDGETVATRTGEVAPGTTAVETVERTFTAPGTYRLTAGEAATTVTVRDPATPIVTALSANRTTLASGGPVELTATVENRADRPGERVLTIRRDGAELLRERVRFGGPGRKTVTATARLPGSGTYRFTAGNASVVVTVDAPGGTDRTATATARGTGDDGGGATRGASGPGFGPLIAVVAVILTVLLGRR